MTADQARNARSADVNNDGYVTLDEVVAMKEAGLSDSEMLSRLQATGQVFDLTSESQKYLREHGVSENVIRDMQSLNQQGREAVQQRLQSNR